MFPVTLQHPTILEGTWRVPKYSQLPSWREEHLWAGPQRHDRPTSCHLAEGIVQLQNELVNLTINMVRAFLS